VSRVWGFKVDREFPDGPLGYEPVVIGDRVRWYTNDRLKGTVLLVGPTVQGYKFALPLVAVQWDGLPREELRKIAIPSKQAAGEICVVLRTELVITEKAADRDPLLENQRWLQEAFGQEDM
jgi:hypothetical protein